MPLIQCPDCGTEVSDLAAACPKCARPINPAGAAKLAAAAPEEVVYDGHPVMFGNHPIQFILLCLMLLTPIPGLVFMPAFPPGAIIAGILFVVALISFVSWWIQSHAVCFTVTNKRTIVRRGILSKFTDEVRHCDIRNLQVSQSLFQRIFGVGRIAISSAAEHEIEVELFGIENPQQIAEQIRGFQDAK